MLDEQRLQFIFPVTSCSMIFSPASFMTSTAGGVCMPCFLIQYAASLCL